MEPLKIRKLTKLDLEDIMDIEHRCFTVPWTKEAFAMEIDGNKFARYVVAELDGKPVGYGGMWMILDEAHITNIAIHPNHRGRGYGCKLVEALIDIALEEGVGRMTLEVRRSNVVAQNLYKKYGFVHQGVRRRYYQDNNEDAIIMWKE